MILDEKSPVAALKHQLKSAGINTDSWGIGKAKSLEDLHKEIENGKSSLIISANGEILRKVEVAKIDLFFNSPDGKKYKLIEDKRVYPDGREKFRDTSHSVSKKINKIQTPHSAIKEALLKKLGLKGDLTLKENGVIEDTNMSPSYPGLRSVYIFYLFSADLNPNDFKSNGYTEKHPEGVTIYTWKEI
ncbi:MAG: hypothetical protein RBS56_00450 [Candidatus Gracilibacteria bacterium]|jgi:hypothetical protein|nr:hypothetical protein [Candidatus Gracilibacteria bacterium]